MGFRSYLYLSYIKCSVFAALAFISTPLLSQDIERNIRFEHITIEDGLKSGSVTDILQDHQGFMWFAGTSNLSKYDGYTITSYEYDQNNSGSISDNAITTLFEDSDGILWVGTMNGGLNKYNRDSDSFVRYQNLLTDSTSISHNNILKIYEDKKGVLWIGTQGGGLNKMDREKGTFVNYSRNPNNKNALPDNNVFSILEDSSGQLWVGTLRGLSILDRNTGKFLTYRNNLDDPSDPKSLSARGVYSICEDNQGTLWIGTYKGLNRFNKTEGTFSKYMCNDIDESKNIVFRITEDSYGNLWTGIWGSGLNKFDRTSETFTTYKHSSKDETSLGDGSVYSIYEDKSNILWIATTLAGISIYKPQNASNFKHYKYNATKNSISEGAITSINENAAGDIWLTNYKGFVDKIDLNGNVFHYNDFENEGQESNPSYVYDLIEDKNKDIIIGTHQNIYKLNKANNVFEHQIVSYNEFFNDVSQIRSIEEDKKGTLWLGTSRVGLLRYEGGIKYSSFISSPTDSTSISSNSISKVYEDPLGTLWIATDDGLNKMDRDKGTFVRYKNNPLDSTSISDNFINDICKDHYGSLWIGTNYGLNVFDEKKGTFRHFTKRNGLPENIVYSILEDNSNNLWITTNNFLIKFNLMTETFKTLNKGNGMPIDEFHSKASLKTSNGKMYFGGMNGIIEFFPDSIKSNTNEPPMVITDFKISNESVAIKKRSSTNASKFYLDKNINVTDTIILSYLDSNFSFEFAALDYVHSPDNLYAYRMNGFNENWIYTDAKNRIATYTNLNPGTYTFIVKGSNNDGIWNESGKSVVVIITPPWWKTNWAYFLYVISFLGALFGFIQWRSLKLKRDKKVLIESVKSKTKDLANKNSQLDHQNIQLQEQASKLKELDESKSRFFANISHEFRTPLTVILGLVNKQIANSDNHASEDPKTIKRNANRLLQLINQLLDLSKIESGKVKLNIAKHNILLVAKKTILLYESIAKEKGIVISFNDALLDKEFPDEVIEVNIDKEQFSKILSNLLSNAIKFTEKRGFIKINIYIESGEAIINISNSGDGIPAKDLPNIFNRFYQVDGDSTREYEGTGIGLSLVKELVDLHEGTIEVESGSNQTRFSIRIPLDLPLTDNKADSEQAIENRPPEDLTIQSNDSHSQDILIEAEKGFKKSEDQLEILVVEDNADIRNYINEILEQDYRVIQAVDGLDGLEKAEAAIPDLIISDVMMPNMDGYELCKTLKNNKTTNHIPVIMLTAKATQENKIEGLEFGADDYLIKPFDEKELKVRIKNLITLRAQLQAKYQQEIWLKPKEVTVSSVHQKFLEDVKDTIEQNIDNDQFSVEDLGMNIGMSRSQIHRKLKALTDQSATQFIRNYRLHRAADLLKQASGNVTEIAYQVGFSSQTYFSKCFQELFGSSPSDNNIK